jgi:hydrogenase-4 component B
VPAWSTASPGVDRGVGYTSFGDANPMRKVLANLLLTKGQLRRAEHPEQDEQSEPEAVSALDVAAPAALHYRVDVVEVVEHYLYRPLEVALYAVVHVAKRLQSGRLDAYLTYMLIALVAVLAVVTAVA